MAFGDKTREELEQAKIEALELFQKREATFLQTARGAVLARYRSVPKRLRKQWLDAYEGELSNAKRIKLFCQECVGYGSNDEIKRCPARGCPFWTVRPFQK